MLPRKHGKRINALCSSVARRHGAMRAYCCSFFEGMHITTHENNLASCAARLISIPKGASAPAQRTRLYLDVHAMEQRLGEPSAADSCEYDHHESRGGIHVLACARHACRQREGDRSSQASEPHDNLHVGADLAPPPEECAFHTNGASAEAGQVSRRRPVYIPRRKRRNDHPPVSRDDKLDDHLRCWPHPLPTTASWPLLMPSSTYSSAARCDTAALESTLAATTCMPWVRLQTQSSRTHQRLATKLNGNVLKSRATRQKTITSPIKPQSHARNRPVNTPMPMYTKTTNSDSVAREAKMYSAVICKHERT